ncbi:MAG: NADH-quinone oxidoreductase subunit C [Candidatus Omnitrophica bacterium]|nr:NADH-quinone oxidoreductase subunit C [Candidatus Omnitrophota bacterium]
MEIKNRIKERLGQKILDWQETSPRRVYFSVKKEDIFETVRVLFKEMGCRFSIASGIDTPQGLEILYHFSFDKRGEIFSVRVLIEDKKHPEIDAITPIFPGAEWIEREMWEMLGINFKGHPNLKRLLLSDDWPEGDYPLRQKNEP